MAEYTPYETVEARCEAEFTEKKSRFIGILSPATTEADCEALLAYAKKKYPGATHYVTAWTLRTNNLLRFNDDGEPGGTSGRPALEVLLREGLSDVAFVSVRYFGGTLLGAGGLVRAYTRSAKEAVDAALRVRMLPCVLFTLNASYSAWQRLSRVLEQKGAKQTGLDYGGSVTWSGEILADRYQTLYDAIREASAGSVLPVKTGEGIRGVRI